MAELNNSNAPEENLTEVVRVRRKSWKHSRRREKTRLRLRILTA